MAVMNCVRCRASLLGLMCSILPLNVDEERSVVSRVAIGACRINVLRQARKDDG